jgi:hypothetical protein
VVAEVANATKVVNGEGKELDALGVKGGDNVKAGHVVATAAKLCLRLLIVPVMSGNRGRRGTWRGWGRFSDKNVDSQVGGRVGRGAVEIGGGEEEANIGGACGIVGDEIAGFNGDAVAGGNKVSPGAEGGADDMKVGGMRP